MGRIATYLTILVVIELVFVITGQMCVGGSSSCTLGSALFGFALDPSSTTSSFWFKTVIGNVADMLSGDSSLGALGSLFGVAVAGIAVGSLIFGLKNDAYLWMGTGLALSLLVNDFALFYAYFYSFSPVVATLIFSPIMVIFTFTCLEWVRGIA